MVIDTIEGAVVIVSLAVAFWALATRRQWGRWFVAGTLAYIIGTLLWIGMIDSEIDAENMSSLMLGASVALSPLLLVVLLVSFGESVKPYFSHNKNHHEPDGPMSPEEQARIDQLTDEEIQAIDEALLENASIQFRKIARVVGSLMMSSTLHKKGIPDIFYADRIRHLVATGQLEFQGDLVSMGSAEVRLPNVEIIEG